MPARVSLKAVKGALKDKKFVFKERTASVIGRGSDCYPRLPNDKDHKTVSRHHCMLNVNPPALSIRDFGSKNGTRVNGEKIGQRAKGFTAKEAADGAFPERQLKHGDLIKVGPSVFQVRIYIPVHCRVCNTEIPRKEISQTAARDELFVCSNCQDKKEGLLEPDPVTCSKCGEELDVEPGVSVSGGIICDVCREDPSQVSEFLVSIANDGEHDIPAIEGYSITGEIGRGGMGAVYLAENRRSGAMTALKIMLPGMESDETAKTMFFREVENTKALNHPNIVRLLDYGFSNGVYYFTVEFCEGGSVDKLMIKRGGVLGVKEATSIAMQVLDGLEYAHNAVIPNVRLADGQYKKGTGLVHRDMKPHNILLTGEGDDMTAKIADFGLAKAFDMAGMSGHTAIGVVSGSPGFTSRQQALKFKYAKPAVDVWSTAASLYYMLTANYARRFPNDKDPWLTIIETKPVPIKERGVNLPDRLAKVIDFALTDQPSIAIKSAAEFKQALKEAL